MFLSRRFPVDPGDPDNQFRWEKGTLCEELDPSGQSVRIIDRPGADAGVVCHTDVPVG